MMRDEFGAKQERSTWLRFHTQTAGCSCTAQQPELNIVRTTLQALAGVLGGTQSLHTNSYDEAIQLPSEDAVRIALRTQQILAHESGVAESVDPFAGSYYVEWLTDTMEEEARRYFDRIDALGGVVAGIERGFFQREIQEASFRYQRAVESAEEKVVGVNAYTVDTPVKVPRLKITEEARRAQSRRLRAVRSRRDPSRHAAALERLRKVAATEEKNTMPAVLEALQADADARRDRPCVPRGVRVVPRAVDVLAPRKAAVTREDTPRRSRSCSGAAGSGCDPGSRRSRPCSPGSATPSRSSPPSTSRAARGRAPPP